MYGFKNHSIERLDHDKLSISISVTLMDYLHWFYASYSHLELLVRLLICCYSGSIRSSLTIAFSLKK